MSKLNPHQRFMRDTAQHAMTIARDDGLYRHVIFKAPGSSIYRFDLITWPGYLCYTGDMGTYVFRRTSDMFTFFRKNSVDASIDYHYWAEKAESHDAQGGVMKFSHAMSRREVRQYVRAFIHNELDAVRYGDDDLKRSAVAAMRELRAAVLQRVLHCDDDEVRAYDAISEFAFHSKAHEHDTEKWTAHYSDSMTFTFTDFWESNYRDFTLRFLWCCHALVWGIAQYDIAKRAQAETQAEPS